MMTNSLGYLNSDSLGGISVAKVSQLPWSASYTLGAKGGKNRYKKGMR